MSTPPTVPVRAPRAPSPSTLGLVFALALLATIALAAWAGYQSGLSARDTQARATQAADLQVQFTRGVEDLAAKRPQVAVTRFEYILERDPAFPGAAEKLAEAQAALQITPAPTVSPAPTAELTISQDPAELLAAAQKLAAAQEWDGVIAEIALLRSVNAAYETLTVDGLLYTALRGRGVARIQNEGMETGIADLDHAAEFRPLDEEARSYRAWARLYLAAKSYYGLDWPRAVGILNDLYLLAPNFKDTATLLYEATLGYAAQLELAGDACGAALQYEDAQRLRTDPVVAERLTAAQTNCLLTPTPAPTDPNAPTVDPNATPTADPGLPATATPTP